MKATRGKGSTIQWRHGLAAASTLVLFACGGGGGTGPGGSGGPDSNAGTGAGGDTSGGGSGVGGAAAGGAPEPMPPGGATGLAADVGTKAIHRLTNLEYNSTVRDLLGTTLQPALAFQPDTEALGFDNIADAADMNPRHVKDYFEAAGALVDDMMANPAIKGTVVACQPAAAGDPACAVQIIQSFGVRAFRRPLEQWELDHYSALYQAALAMPLTIPVTHDEAIGQVVRTMITAPQFLYRMEIDADPFSVAQRALNGYEIASRLSYMLWSTMPDQALFDAAASGALLQLDTLQAQVDRMLLDGKSSTLVNSFAWQWFGMNHLPGHAVDAVQYPAWSETMRASMQGEMQLFFDEFIRQGRPVPELLTADVNYVDETLAGVYGVAAPATPGFTRMEITTDERKGVIGLAGFLTHTSRHNRTAPTIRGAWVLNALMCQDIAPPTNIVIAPLPEVDPTLTSVKELIEVHRDNEACRGCHALVDPVGLGIEQYDAIGRLRTQYENGDPIDTAGEFPGGVTFTGFSDMVDKLAAMTQSDTDPTLRTAQCAAKKLFTYALGRPVAPSDAYLDQLITKWEEQPLTMNNLIKALVVNDVFRFRHGTPDAM